MLRDLDKFFLEKKEPNKSCFMALRHTLMNFSPSVTEHWKYKLPFYYYNKKPFCYLWYDKKSDFPYIGIVKGGMIDDPHLVQGNRKIMKILPIDPKADLPVSYIQTILKEAASFY